uniref:Uncharacterized protein n=1 Tax=Marseillevirus LCMAC101 TaxID=2506602 RepID=A0A481YSL3_9VIRU|nr:MAG: hypothetical protein LCMAC101_00510 [Marseillevirus LCMAC101]
MATIETVRRVKEDAKQDLAKAQKNSKECERRLRESKEKEKLAQQELEKKESEILSSYYGEEARGIVDGWKARIRVLKRNTGCVTHQTRHVFMENRKREGFLVDREYKTDSLGSKMELEACIALGIDYSTEDTMPYFQKGS